MSITYTLEEYENKFCNDDHRTAHDELNNYKIYNHYKKLKSITNKTPDNNAVFLICDFLITCVLHDEIEGDYYDEENNIKMRKAGEILHNIGGLNYMNTTLLSFIPRRYRRNVDYIWDGIGTWKC